MKNLLIFCTLLLCYSANGQNPPTQKVHTKNVQLGLSDNQALQVNMDLILPEDLKISSNRMIILTPVVRSGDREALLTPVYVYGRKRQIISERKNRLPVEGSQVLRRKNHKEQVINYSASTLYQPWMKGANVVLEQDLCGCGNKKEENESQLLTGVPSFIKIPEVQYCVPTNEAVKRRIYKGTAYIDFPVNKITIYPSYRRNPIELARIDSTLRGFKDKDIRAIRIHGYASPEGPHTHNAYLAKERTNALKNHIITKFSLPDSLFTTAYTPEDWAGFVKFAQQSDLKEKNEILDIAGRDIHPDTKEELLKRMGEAYAYMSANWFPALRHSDYEIEYILPNFTAKEARIMARQNPSQLSLRELYDAAQLCEKGSDEYYNIMEAAISVYPDNPEANLNAAAMELERGNLTAAKKYMEKVNMTSSAAQNNMKRITMLEEEKK